MRNCSVWVAFERRTLRSEMGALTDLEIRSCASSLQPGSSAKLEANVEKYIGELNLTDILAKREVGRVLYQAERTQRALKNQGDQAPALALSRLEHHIEQAKRAQELDNNFTTMSLQARQKCLEALQDVEFPVNLKFDLLVCRGREAKPKSQASECVDHWEPFWAVLSPM